jgi:putative Ca2+/H+ antiporter (TMEM165/GDT1 family)
MNLQPFITTLLVIGMAELGDKTQLLTLSFATRFPLWEVLAGISCASALLMGMAVFFGGIIHYYIPDLYIQIFSGIFFLFIGILTIISKEKEEEAKLKSHNPFWIVFVSFLIAELGDKTQLATIAFSAEYGNPLQVWLGATLAMFGVNGLGILIGRWAKDFISKLWMKWLGAIIFILIGIITLIKLWF